MYQNIWQNLKLRVVFYTFKNDYYLIEPKNELFTWLFIFVYRRCFECPYNIALPISANHLSWNSKKYKKVKCFNFIINQNCGRVESNWAFIEADKRVWWYEDIKEKYEDTIKGYLIIHNHRQKVMIKE